MAEADGQDKTGNNPVTKQMKRRDIVFAVLGVFLIGFLALLASLNKLKRHAESVKCGNQISSICLGATVWAYDNGGHYSADFRSMSNELNTTRILICPSDHLRQIAVNWDSFTASNSSYTIITSAISTNKADEEIAYLRCEIHGHLGYPYGIVFDGKRKRTKSSW